MRRAAVLLLLTCVVAAAGASGSGAWCRRRRQRAQPRLPARARRRCACDDRLADPAPAPCSRAPCDAPPRCAPPAPPRARRPPAEAGAAGRPGVVREPRGAARLIHMPYRAVRLPVRAGVARAAPAAAALAQRGRLRGGLRRLPPPGVDMPRQPPARGVHQLRHVARRRGLPRRVAGRLGGRWRRQQQRRERRHRWRRRARGDGRWQHPGRRGRRAVIGRARLARRCVRRSGLQLLACLYGH